MISWDETVVKTGLADFRRLLIIARFYKIYVYLFRFDSVSTRSFRIYFWSDWCALSMTSPRVRSQKVFVNSEEQKMYVRFHSLMSDFCSHRPNHLDVSCFSKTLLWIAVMSPRKRHGGVSVMTWRIGLLALGLKALIHTETSASLAVYLLPVADYDNGILFVQRFWKIRVN